MNTKVPPTQIMFDDLQEKKKPKKSVEPEKIDKKLEEDIIVGSASHNILDLPSKGRFNYPSSVEFRDIMVKDEEVLASATGSTYVRTLNAVVKSVLNDCPFYEKLKIADRDFIILWLWATNYSSKKETLVECSHCGVEERHTVDLLKLETIELKDSLVEPFKIPLSKISGQFMYVSLNTVADELFAEDYLSKNKDGMSYEQIMLYRSIDIGVSLPFDAKVNWIRENVTGKEMGYVRQFHAYFNFGIDTKISHTCSACKGVTQTILPFQAEDILFPTVQSDFEKFL